METGKSRKDRERERRSEKKENIFEYFGRKMEEKKIKGRTEEKENRRLVKSVINLGEIKPYKIDQKREEEKRKGMRDEKERTEKY